MYFFSSDCELRNISAGVQLLAHSIWPRIQCAVQQLRSVQTAGQLGENSDDDVRRVGVRGHILQ